MNIRVTRPALGATASIFAATLGFAVGSGTAAASIVDPGTITTSSTSSTVTVTLNEVRSSAPPIGCDITTVSALGTTDFGRIWLDDQGNGTYTSPAIKGLAKTTTYCYDEDIIGYEYPSYEAAYPGEEVVEPQPCSTDLARLLRFGGSSECSNANP